MTAERREKLKRKAHRLRAEQGLSLREIAGKLGVSKSTVGDWLREDPPEASPVPGIQDESGKPVAGAEPGNDRAVTHGCYSETKLAPLREHHAKEIRSDYQHLDGRRVALLADRLARIDLGSAWLERQEGVVRDEEGRVYDVADKVERWSQHAERVIAEAEAEARERGRGRSLVRQMQEVGQ